MPPVFPGSEAQPLPLPDVSSSRLSSDGEDDTDESRSGSPQHISHHPRPIAVSGRTSV